MYSLDTGSAMRLVTEQFMDDGEEGILCFGFARFMGRGFRGDRLKSAVTTGRGLVAVWCDRRVTSTFVECGRRATNTCSCVIRGMDTW